MDRYDIAIIGTGPAGISAAITSRIRNKTVLLLGSEEITSKLAKAHRIENYPGFPGITGGELAEAFKKHLDAMEIPITTEKVTTVYSMGKYFSLQAASGKTYESTALILATGVVRVKLLPGEEKFLGSGVSTCATCDAPLYKGKIVAVIADDPKEEAEAKFLSEVCANVKYFPLYSGETNLPDIIEVIREKPTAIESAGLGKKAVVTENSRYEVNGVFTLRQSVAVGQLVPGLKTDNGHIIVDREMRTNIAGLFAAGDIVGRPYQYIKSAGEGNIAAISAVDYLSKI